MSQTLPRDASAAPRRALPPLMQEAGVPLDVFIASITEQLDRAQAAMALKARVAKLPLTFAVKDVSLDLRAFVQLVDDDVFVRPAGPGDAEASTIRLALTTITRSMVEENAIDFAAERPQFSLREATHGHLTDDDEKRLERIGVRTVEQLTALRKTAGADVVARLARMPVNRLQQALMAAAAPRVTQPNGTPAPNEADESLNGSPRLDLHAPALRAGRLPFIRAAGQDVPVVESHDGRVVLAPYPMQLGCPAEVDFGGGERARVVLAPGSVGRWMDGVPP